MKSLSSILIIADNFSYLPIWASCRRIASICDSTFPSDRVLCQEKYNNVKVANGIGTRNLERRILPLLVELVGESLQNVIRDETSAAAKLSVKNPKRLLFLNLQHLAVRCQLLWNRAPKIGVGRKRNRPEFEESLILEGGGWEGEQWVLYYSVLFLHFSISDRFLNVGSGCSFRTRLAGAILRCPSRGGLVGERAEPGKSYGRYFNKEHRIYLI